MDGAIHRAGGPAILAACEEIVAARGRLPTGEAVVTTGGELPAAHVIHTVGPVWGGGRRDEAALLARAYRNSLACAVDIGARSVAFPSISTGVYRYPIEEACCVAVDTVLSFVRENGAPAEVLFVLFSRSDHGRVYACSFSAKSCSSGTDRIVAGEIPMKSRRSRPRRTSGSPVTGSPAPTST